MQRESRNLRRFTAEGGIQLGDARRDVGASDVPMELHSGGNRKDVLVRQEATGRDEGCLRPRQFIPLLPGLPRLEAVRVKGGDGRTHVWPRVASPPEKAGATRREEPLVRRRREEVAACAGNVHVLIRESINAIDDQEATVPFATTPIRFRYRVRHLLEGKLHTRRGMHPGDHYRS